MVFGNMVQPCPSLDVHINGGTRDPRTVTDWSRTRTSEFSKPRTGPDQDREKIPNLGSDWTRTNRILKISGQFGSFGPGGGGP